MHHQAFRKAAALAILFSAGIGPLANAQTTPAAITSTNTAGKEVLIPQRITRVPEGNDFNNPDSEYSFQTQQIHRQLRPLLGQGIRR